MAIETRDVDGITGLVTAVLEIGAGVPEGQFLWFRGLGLSSHSMLPKIMREGHQPDEIFERERRLLTRFRQRSMAYWPAGYPQSDWEHQFAMQHYGMPTRLLDWSENLFVAAHFALAPLATPPAEEDLPAVWCLNPVVWNRSAPQLRDYGESIHVLTTSDDEIDAYRPETSKRRLRFPLAIFGSHNSDRIVSQRGTFMVWGNDNTSLETFTDETPAPVWKLRIRGDRLALARELSTLGFGETMVFPELSSLATELTRIEGWR